MAFGGIVFESKAAGRLARVFVHRAQEHKISRSAGQFTTAKAVAAIGREWAAGFVADIALHRVELGAGRGRSRRVGIGIVFASRSVFRLGIVVGRNGMRVAGVIPVAVVVARA